MAATRTFVPYPATLGAATKAETKQDEANHRGRVLHGRTITDLIRSDEQHPSHANMIPCASSE